MLPVRISSFYTKPSCNNEKGDLKYTQNQEKRLVKIKVEKRDNILVIILKL